MAIDWEAELDSLGNDDRESWAAEKNYTEDSSGIPEAMGPVPPLFSTIPRLFADTSLRFDMKVYLNNTNERLQTLSAEWNLRISSCP